MSLPVPAEAVMEDLSPTRTQEGEDMFKVRRGACRRTKRRRIE